MSENNHDNTDNLPALSAEAWLRYWRNAVIGAFTPDWASFNDLHSADTRNQSSMRIFENALARNPLGELPKYAMLDVNHEGGRDARSWFAENSLKDTLSTTCSVVTPETLSEHKKACSEALNGIADSFHRFLRRVRKVVFLSQLAKDAPKDATELYGVPLHYFRRYELMFTYVTNDANDPLKTVVDWEGLRALAAKDAAEEVAANKSANLMKGMNGSSNYGHRFTR